MSNTFETTLTNIKGQESIFKDRDERAVEIGVVLPLLRQVGWNTDNVSEIYPQHELPDSTKVDYDLQIDGESQILIEVKRWGHNLDERDEKQLADYCRSAKPKLAVLTSGQSWRLYLPPTKGKSTPLRRFLELDLVTDQTTEIVSNFRQFLARNRMSDDANVDSTVKTAADLHKTMQDYEEQKKLLSKAWNELANEKEKNKLAKLLENFAEREHITISQGNVMRFLNSLHGPLVNEVPAKPLPPPHSFRLPSSPNGSKGTRKIKKSKGWNNFLVEICELMQDRHPESFRKHILSMPEWFSDSEEYFSNSTPVGNEGIYAKWGGSREIRKACYEMLDKFDYPEDSLEIRGANGVRL